MSRRTGRREQPLLGVGGEPAQHRGAEDETAHDLADHPWLPHDPKSWPPSWAIVIRATTAIRTWAASPGPSDIRYRPPWEPRAPRTVQAGRRRGSGGGSL
ncbi:hypothetical protein [Streptomyces jumonjinensis]|uniref:hypothetical protein n=1 Tax=Streptomyces jumonjinensis TaxID=1945 RepID=UPI00378DEB01